MRRTGYRWRGEHVMAFVEQIVVGSLPRRSPSTIRQSKMENDEIAQVWRDHNRHNDPALVNYAD
jgi:hypothetical protein